MNVKNSYHMRQNVMRWLLQMFSAKFLVVIYLGLLTVQYMDYGALDGGQYWVPKPGFLAHLDFMIRYVVWPHVWHIAAAVLIDWLTWPLILRSELD